MVIAPSYRAARPLACTILLAWSPWWSTQPWVIQDKVKCSLDLLDVGYLGKTNKLCECNFNKACALFQHGNGFSTLDNVSLITGPYCAVTSVFISGSIWGLYRFSGCQSQNTAIFCASASLVIVSTPTLLGYPTAVTVKNSEVCKLWFSISRRWSDWRCASRGTSQNPHWPVQTGIFQHFGVFCVLSFWYRLTWMSHHF